MSFEMRKRDCSERCLVSPHPTLLNKMQRELAGLGRRRLSFSSEMLTVKRAKPVGMDDGMIFPGDEFPWGLPPSRSAERRWTAPR